MSGNSASSVGGAIFNVGIERGAGIVQIVNSTFNGNSTAHGPGDIENYGETANLEIGSTILNSGASGANITNISGSVTSLGYNLSSDAGGGFLTATGDQINTDPMLGPLQDNGGPTLTHALLTDSPAIDAGDPNFAPPPDFDQRGPGFPRVVNGRIDIGAFEVQAKSASEQIADLIALVNGLSVPAVVKNALLVKLQAPQTALDAGTTTAVCGVLKAFINLAMAQSGKQLTAAQADELIADAQRIRTALGC
jgi:hypothetical protein